MDVLNEFLAVVNELSRFAHGSLSGFGFFFGLLQALEIELLKSGRVEWQFGFLYIHNNKNLAQSWAIRKPFRQEEVLPARPM